MIRGIRGAVCPTENTEEAIFQATCRLLDELLGRNLLESEQIASIFITATSDLNAQFPACAVRTSGLSRVPILCAAAIDVPGAMRSVIRMLIHAETTMSQDEIHHVYLGKTSELRPDLARAQQQRE